MRSPLRAVVLVLGVIALWASQARAGEVSQGQEYKRFRTFVTWSE